MEERKVIFTTMPYCKPGWHDQSEEEYDEYCKKRIGTLDSVTKEPHLNSNGETKMIATAHIIEDGTNKEYHVPLENVELSK